MSIKVSIMAEGKMQDPIAKLEENNQHPITKKERYLRIFAKWFISPIFALGSGVVIAVAASGLPFIATLALPWTICILSSIFIAETLIYFYFLKDSVPDTLVDIFIKDTFDGLTPIKKFLLALGLIVALGGAFAQAGLTFTSTTTALTAIFGLFGATAPPALAFIVSLFLAAIGFIAIYGVLVKWISKAIREDAHLKFWNFLKEIFTRDLEKPLLQQVLEGIFKLLFTSIIVTLTLIGTIAVVGTMYDGLYSALESIPHASLYACEITGIISAYVFMGSSRLAWVLQSTCSVFSTLGELCGRMIFNAIDSINKILNSQSANDEAPNEVQLDNSQPKDNDIGQKTPTNPQITEQNTESTKEEETCVDKVLFFLTSLGNLLICLIHGVSYGALAESGGGELWDEIMTKMHVPLEPEVMQEVANEMALWAGTGMALGIGAQAAGVLKPFEKPEKCNKSEGSKSPALVLDKTMKL